MSKIELKPCPFCNSVNLYVCSPRNTEGDLIACRCCGAEGPDDVDHITAWNTRAPDPALATKDATIAELRRRLRQIERIAGNLPDDVLCSATGPNDASYRGGLVCTARDIARAALETSR